MAKPTSCVLSERPKVECARDECSHEHLGVRSGVIDLFPKDENRETEVSRGFRFFVSGGRFCEKIFGEMLGFLDYFL